MIHHIHHYIHLYMVINIYFFPLNMLQGIDFLLWFCLMASYINSFSPSQWRLGGPLWRHWRVRARGRRRDHHKAAVCRRQVVRRLLPETASRKQPTKPLVPRVLAAPLPLPAKGTRAGEQQIQPHLRQWVPTAFPQSVSSCAPTVTFSVWEEKKSQSCLSQTETHDCLLSSRLFLQISHLPLVSLSFIGCICLSSAWVQRNFFKSSHLKHTHRWKEKNEQFPSETGIRAVCI